MFKKKVKIYEAGCVFALTMVASAPSWAKDAAAVSKTVKGNFGAIGEMFLALFLLGGIILVGMGLLKLKAHRDNPQQVPLSQPMTMIIIGGLLTVILGLMTIAGDSAGLTGEGRDLANDADTAGALFAK